MLAIPIYLTFHIVQLDIVSKLLQHLHKGFIYNIVVFADKSIDIWWCRFNRGSKIGLCCPCLNTFHFDIYFNIIFDHDYPLIIKTMIVNKLKIKIIYSNINLWAFLSAQTKKAAHF